MFCGSSIAEPASRTAQLWKRYSWVDLKARRIFLKHGNSVLPGRVSSTFRCKRCEES